MIKSILYLIPLMVLILTSHSEAWDLKRGDLFHITGCEDGELLLRIVNMWDKPGGLVSGAKVIGKLSGNGRRDRGLRCQGSIVRAIDLVSVRGRTFIKIKSVVNVSEGWITDSFVGRKFDKAKCNIHFSEPEYIRNCNFENNQEILSDSKKKSTNSPSEIRTSKGIIRLSGTAFMDGRDLEAELPVTVMIINVWDHVPREKVICKLRHNSKVKILEIKKSYEEKRFYFKVKDNSCEGWVSEPFVSSETNEPIGEHYY